MADKIQTLAGEVHVLTRDESFAELANLINQLASKGRASVGLSGGSTPKAFYSWAVKTDALSAEAIAQIDWHVSDERCVPLDSDDSNFGHAQRGLLNPLKVSAKNYHPWPVDKSPAEAAKTYNQAWKDQSPQKTFDLCVLGLGDDSHIASLWPQCPLIGTQSERFVATEWPGRGWRLTITEAGLAECGKIIVLVNGKAKAPALAAVCSGEYDPKQHPGQTLRSLSNRAIWLADEDAASLIK
jgi:6-phosphogluconolactonase